MHEGFIGVEFEHGFPSAASSESLTGEALMLRRELPEGADVPDAVIRGEAEKIEAFARDERGASKKRVEKTLLEELRQGKMFVVGAAMCALAETGCATRIGPGARGLTIEQIEAEYPTWEGRPDLKGMPTYEEIRDELEEAIGEEGLDMQVPVRLGDYVDSERARREKQEQIKGPFRVEGFEEKYGVPDENIREIFSGTLPRGWTGAGTVASFGVSSEPLRFEEGYGLHGHADGVCRGGKWDEAAELLVGPDYRLSAETPGVFIHELAHANDWERTNVMTPEDRTTLLYLVHRRVSSPDHLRFPYVESISNEDKRIEHLYKCMEYWAVLMERALTIPADSAAEWEREFRARASALWAHPQAVPSPESLGQKDLELVKWYLKKTDPSFKPWEAARKRSEGIRETMTDAYAEHIGRILSRIESAPLRTSLMNTFSGEIRPEMRLLPLAQAGGVRMPDKGEHMAKFSRAFFRTSAGLMQSVPARLRTAFAAAHELQLAIKDIRERFVQDLADVTTETRSVEGLTRNLNAALRGCSAEDLSELERTVASYDALYRGQVELEGRRPAWLASMAEDLERNGKL